jgi:DNA-binding Lrp family transcriptional regulator
VTVKDADAKIVTLLTRAGPWLATTTVAERTGLSWWHVKERVKALERAGRLKQRKAPDDGRVAEWAVTE